MIKNIAFAGVAIMATCFSAQAATNAPPAPTTFTASQYAGVLQFTAVNDPNGFCTGLVAVGETQLSEGSFALGGSPSVVTPITGTSQTGYGVSQQVCTYAQLPASLNASGTTDVSGTTTCTVPNPTYPTAQIVTGQTIDGVSGQANINTVNKFAESFKITTTNAALEVQVQGQYTPICFISTDALYVRTGK